MRTGWSPSRRWRTRWGTFRGSRAAGSCPTPSRARPPGSASRSGWDEPPSVPGADPRALRGVHDLETLGLELVAELVGPRVVLRRPGGVALLHEPQDVLRRHPGLPSLPLHVQTQHAVPRREERPLP